jgi:uncharacterized membrane protein
MAEAKDAKKVYTLEEIKFNEENKTMAILSCIPLIGLIMMFVEKDDQFVRYMGAQYTLVGALELVAIIPVLGWIIAPLIMPVIVVLMIIGMVKVSKGERFDVPVFSNWALKLMGMF